MGSAFTVPCLDNNNDVTLVGTHLENELITTLAIYAGFSGLAGGQYFDLTFENKKTSKKKITYQAR